MNTFYTYYYSMASSKHSCRSRNKKAPKRALMMVALASCGLRAGKVLATPRNSPRITRAGSSRAEEGSAAAASSSSAAAVTQGVELGAGSTVVFYAIKQKLQQLLNTCEDSSIPYTAHWEKVLALRSVIDNYNYSSNITLFFKAMGELEASPQAKVLVLLGHMLKSGTESNRNGQIYGAAFAISPSQTVDYCVKSNKGLYGLNITNKQMIYAQITESLQAVNQKLDACLQEARDQQERHSSYSDGVKKILYSSYSNDVKKILGIMYKIANADTALTEEEKLTVMNSALEHLTNTTHTIEGIEGWLGKDITKEIQRVMHEIANDAVTLAPGKLAGKPSILTVIARPDFQPTQEAIAIVMKFAREQQQQFLRRRQAENQDTVRTYDAMLNIVNRILETKDVHQLPALYDLHEVLREINDEIDDQS